MDALSYVFGFGHASASVKDVTEVASFFSLKEKNMAQFLNNGSNSLITAGLKKLCSLNLRRPILLCLPFLCIFGCVDPPPPPQISPQKLKIKNINLVFESSLSMKGYLSGGTELQRLVSDLAAYFDKHEKDSLIGLDHYYRTDDSNIIHITNEASIFIKQIESGTLAFGKNTPLNNFLKTIIDKCDSGSIYGIISDMIYSPSDGVTLATMSGSFQTVFNVAKQKGLAFSIYQYYSKFNGTYWDYSGNTHDLRNHTRPYYIWFIGPKNLMKILNDHILNEKQFTRGNQIHIGYNYERIDFYVFDKSIKLLDGEFYYEEGCISVTTEDSILVPLGVDVSKLPYYYKDHNYLTKHLKLSSANIGSLKVIEVLDRDSIYNQMAEEEINKVNNLSHIIQIRARNLSSGTYYCNLDLDKQHPIWYADISCDYDAKIKSIHTNKTYAFKYIIEGAIKALENDQPVFSLKLKFCL